MISPRLLFGSLIFIVISACNAANDSPVRPDYVVQTQDADRFVEMYNGAQGLPSAEDINQKYLAGSGRGVEVFTPHRIIDGDNMARAIANDPEAYRRAIDVCLPIVKNLNTELNEIYASIADLLPGRKLPEVYAVFGAGNSGGTAAPDAQVIGLEVICAGDQTTAQIRKGLLSLFAHETIHSLQPEADMSVFEADPLLYASLMEGVADYIAGRITGRPPSEEREAWASLRKDQVRDDFMRDRRLILDGIANGATFADPPPELMAAYGRWIANYQNAPEGWPAEMGYWVGMNIAAQYIEASGDTPEALNSLLALDDPAEILEKSGY